MEGPRVQKSLTLDQVALLAALASHASEDDGLTTQRRERSGVALSPEEWKRLNRCAEALGMRSAVDGRPGTNALMAGSKRSRYLTPFGSRAARQAALIVHELEVLRAMAFVDPDGLEVPFTCFPAHVVRYHEVLMPSKSARSRLKAVGVSPEQRLDSGQRVAELLKSGQVLLALGPAGLDVGQGFGSRPLYRSNLKVVVRKDSRFAQYAYEGRPVPVKELASVEVAVAPRGHLSRSLFEEACAEAGLDIEPAIEHADVNLLRALAEDIDRVAIMLADAFGRAVPAWWPAVDGGSGDSPGIDYHVYWSEDPQLPTEVVGALEATVERLFDIEATPDTGAVSGHSASVSHAG